MLRCLIFPVLKITAKRVNSAQLGCRQRKKQNVRLHNVCLHRTVVKLNPVDDITVFAITNQNAPFTRQKKNH